MKQVIYETKGRAREFNPLAINLFTGCDHKCTYCYGADITHQTKDAFENAPRPRVTVDDIKRSAAEYAAKGETRRVLLCFVTDPYAPMEEPTQLTRHAIKALHEAGLNVIILTKGGMRATRDLDLLTPKDAFATTLTCMHDGPSRDWEPNAAVPTERMLSLRMAHDRGIETWVSFEPVINPEITKELMRNTRSFVGHYKVGTMNYHPSGKMVDWGRFGWEMKREMDSLGVKYYFKRDLVEKMNIPFERFNQTWVCK